MERDSAVSPKKETTGFPSRDQHPSTLNRASESSSLLGSDPQAAPASLSKARTPPPHFNGAVEPNLTDLAAFFKVTNQ